MKRLLAFIGVTLLFLLVLLGMSFFLANQFNSLPSNVHDNSSPETHLTINPFLIFVLLLGVVLWVGISVTGELPLSRTEERDLTRIQEQESKAAKELKGDQTDFATLWALNQQRIDRYHRIATRRATMSYASTNIATIAGFGMIIYFGYIASQAQTAAGAITAGSVGAVGTGLSAYIGRTFMKAQAEASVQLREFFLQPVEWARLLGAERLTDSLEPSERSEAVQQIVRSMMSPSPTSAQQVQKKAPTRRRPAKTGES